MAKTVFENENVTVEQTARVKQMLRTLAPFSDGSSRDAIQSVDLELSEWVNAGWRLFSTHFTGGDAQGGVTVLYVLVKD